MVALEWFEIGAVGSRAMCTRAARFPQRRERAGLVLLCIRARGPDLRVAGALLPAGAVGGEPAGCDLLRDLSPTEMFDEGVARTGFVHVPPRADLYHSMLPRSGRSNANLALVVALLLEMDVPHSLPPARPGYSGGRYPPEH